MGGKSKQARVKNNAKPSNSSRSAELLGTSVPTFVGFSAHSEHGLIPFAPGFSDNSALDTLEQNIDPQLQLILRKMSKKDPVTKVKALQEFSEMLNAADVETVKGILPLWPKFYQNLSNDVDHRVRESAQEVMSIVVSKCKKAVAPFLKQLVPAWLASTFDNYAPAASTASTSFTETFANNTNKVRDVCLHCQQEIVEYTVRNLTFHTASTLSMSKNCTPEEAEQKYQRVVYSSLKTLSFFMDKTNGSEINNVRQSIQDMLANSKFWSFAKHKVVKVKASWFELLYNLLQNTSVGDLMLGCKPQLISTCFQHLDESDPLIAPHVWGCILQVQSSYEDWHDVINVQKSVLPKLSSVLRSGCNKNATAICPNLLPFLSKLSQESLKDTDLNEFYKEFFDDIKSALTTIANISKSDCSAISAAYFECLRYVFQKMNSSIDKDGTKTFAHKLLDENIIFLTKWCLTNEGHSVKFIILHSSSLIAYWADPEKKSEFYSEFLEEFWKNMIKFITESLENKKDEKFLDHVIELVEKLHSVNSKYEDQRVKFVFGSEENQESDNHTSNSVKTKSNLNQSEKSAKSPTTVTYVELELKKLVIQLIRLCLSNLTKETSSNYIAKIRKLTSMFCDLDFYLQISEEKSIMGTLNLFLKNMHSWEDVAVDDGMDIIFEILNLLPKDEKFNFIKTKLLQIPQTCIQYAVMNRLLSYPLNVEPQVRNILSQPEACDIITSLARDTLADDSKDSFNLLRKCFFQSDAGEIPINSKTVDNILNIVSQPLTAHSKMDHLMDVCGSFISQIMSVVCGGGNSSVEVQRDIFHKLFEFTVEHMPDDNISEDTLWEISTCWQDALSCQDIKVDSEMLHKCKATLNNFVQRDNLTFEAIDSTAEAINQFIMCSTEHISDETERLVHIDSAIREFFTPQDLNQIKQIQDLCLFQEALQSKVSVGQHLDKECLEDINMTETFRQMLLNSCILYKMVCKHSKTRKNSLNDDSEEHENTDDYCDVNVNVLKQWTNTLYEETITCINMASVGESLVENISQIDVTFQTLAVELSEKVKMLLREGSEDFISNLKERMFDIAAQDNDITSCRALIYLVCINQYEQFEENAHILLIEELFEFFVSRNSLKAYVNTLQYFLPNLTSKAITMHMPIMRTNPTILWIRASIFRCLVENNFNSNYNEKSDQNIIAHTIRFLSEVSDKQHSNKDLLMYNVDVSQQPILTVVDTIEFINILQEVIQKFPYELTIKNWDAVRIGLSSWVLSVSKSIDHIKNPQVALFITKVFQLYAALTKFIQNDKQKSSTEILKNMVDEWENLFSREVNLVLFKSYYRLIEMQEETQAISSCFNSVLENITPAIELLDYEVVYNFYKSSTKVTLDNVLNFLLKNLSNHNHYIRTHCVNILKEITKYFVRLDIEIYESKSENVSTSDSVGDWHFLSKLEDYIGRYETPIRKYLDDFSFKLTDIADMKSIDRNECLCYLFLWDCIIYVCSNSPITLRSVYTNWLHEKRYEENFIYFLFRAMPPEILKNHDSKIMITDVFKGLTWNDIKDKNLAVEKYACHLYTEVLRRLPAVVRKWWNTCQSRQKTFVDKLTTNFVSPIICNEELKAIGNKKEKHENMQVTVHTSTREVLAVYSIDEARMELVITLAPNYPLGSVKVEIGKQIGGRLASRNIGMQLTIFLTHQNGSIFDGLTLWKNNLDKKFEGVEECYVCYTVIHQETCQLPKLSCKTCRKKFHGPCLYKWFTTSSKSTCPICRNVF